MAQQVTKTSQPAPNVLIQQMPIFPQQQQSSLGPSPSVSTAQHARPTPCFPASGPQQQQYPFSTTGHSVSQQQQQHYSQIQQQQQFSGHLPSQQTHQSMSQQQLQSSLNATIGSCVTANVQNGSQLRLAQKSAGGAGQFQMRQEGLPPASIQGTVAGSSARSTSSSHYGSSFFLGVFGQIDEMSPLSLSRLGKDLTQEAVNRMGELFAYTKALELPNPTIGRDYYFQRQKMLKHFVDLLHYLQTLMKKIAEIRERLEKERNQNLELDINNLDEEEMLALLLGKSVSSKVEEIKQSSDYQNMLTEKNSLVVQLSAKRDELTDIADFMRSLEWEIGILVGKEHI